MELSLGGSRTRLLQGLEPGWGMGRREEIQQWLKMVPGGVAVIYKVEGARLHLHA